jgi:hypothetical protein
MPLRLRRFGGHLRRHLPVYIVGVFAFTFSPLPSMAAALVTTDQIANGAVTTPKLAVDSVDGRRILNESVTGADLKNSTVLKGDLAPNSVNGPRVTNESLTGAEVKNGTIGNADLGLNSVNGATVTDGSLTVADLASDTAESLQSPAYRYVIPATNDGLSSRSYSFPDLPRGIYFASYSILTAENVSLPVRCAFTDDNERGYSQSAMPLGSFRTNNASTVLDFTDEVGMLSCNMGSSSAGFEIVGDIVKKSDVTFVRLDQLTGPAIGVE